MAAHIEDLRVRAAAVEDKCREEEALLTQGVYVDVGWLVLVLAVAVAVTVLRLLLLAMQCRCNPAAIMPIQ